VRAFGGRMLAFFSLLLPGPRAFGAWVAKPPRVAIDGSGGLVIFERDFKSGGVSVTVRVAAFDDRRHTLRVVDNPASARVTLADAMRRAGCDAGVNGGFFHADWTPLGLLVSAGRLIHPMERAKLLSGVLAVTRERPLLLRYAEYRLGPQTRDGLQAGPFLVDRGTAVFGLKNRRRERRTAVATDGHHRWAIIATGPVGLSDLAAILAGDESAAGFKVARALNLDGGSSTAFWAVGAEGIGCAEVGFVRNFVAVVKREKP